MDDILKACGISGVGVEIGSKGHADYITSHGIPDKAALDAEMATRPAGTKIVMRMDRPKGVHPNDTSRKWDVYGHIQHVLGNTPDGFYVTHHIGMEDGQMVAVASYVANRTPNPRSMRRVTGKVPQGHTTRRGGR